MSKLLNNKLLQPKIDVVFHALFRKENNQLTEALISDILDEKVKIISNMDRHLNIKDANEKFGVMDLKVKLQDNTKCNIEIQLNTHQNECERFLYYLCNTYSDQLNRGDDYSKLNRCISIVILDHTLEKLKDSEKLNVKWQMRDNETGRKILTNKFELVIIELPKAKKQYVKNPEDKICQWMMFLDNPNNKEVLDIMDKNESIKQAVDELESVSGDYEIRRIAELKLKAIRDEKSINAYIEEKRKEAVEQALQEGLEKGIQEGLEKGIQEGLEKGIQEGLEKGMQEGLEKGYKEGIIKGRNDVMKTTVKNLLNQGFSIQQVSSITGIPDKEIQELK